jgi:drug/metabolite transporter (DMT)-like permease
MLTPTAGVLAAPPTGRFFPGRSLHSQPAQAEGREERLRLGAWAVLATRVARVGVERVLLRAMGEGRSAEETAAAFFGAGALMLLPAAAPWTRADWAFLRWAAPGGLVYAVAYWFYVAAFAQGDVSAVAPVGTLSGVFVVLLGWLVLREPLSWSAALGVALIAASALALRPRPDRAASARPRGVAYGQMIGYAALTALTRLFDHAAAKGAPDAAPLYAWLVFSEVACCQCLLLAAQRRLGHLWALVSQRPLLVLAAGACNGGSFLLLVVAMTMLPVSLIEPVTACSLLVSAVLAWVVFREPVRRRWLPTLGVILGTWVLVAGAGHPAG